MDARQAEALRAEASRLRKEYYYLRKALKQRPGDRQLRKRAENIQARYAEIRGMVKDAPSAGKPGLELPSPPAPPLDMSAFEPKPFEMPRAVVLNKPNRVADVTKSLGITKKKVWYSILTAILLVTAPFYYLMFFKGMAFFEVPTNSMIPTVEPGDRFVAIVPSSYRRGDVVVVEDPNDPAAFLVKRLVGLPGDEVAVRHGTLQVNGTAIYESYLREPMQYELEPVRVGEDEVFLLGDNRNESDDGHVWREGFPLSKVTGRVFYIYAPAARRGSLESQAGAFAQLPEP